MTIDTYIGQYHISTKWVKGLEVFETMVFDHPRSGWLDIDCVRSDSVEDALNTHLKLVKSYALVR